MFSICLHKDSDTWFFNLASITFLASLGSSCLKEGKRSLLFSLKNKTNVKFPVFLKMSKYAENGNTDLV
jgi:hypothetical protein